MGSIQNVIITTLLVSSTEMQKVENSNAFELFGFGIYLYFTILLIN